MAIQEYTIGRGEDCQIRVQDSGQRISRRHATLKVMNNGKIFITDYSSNGTFVNGVKIASNANFPVKRGDVISFANEIELDWTLIPKVTNKLLIYAIIALILIGAGIAAFCLWDSRDAGRQPGQEEYLPPDSLEIKPDSLEISIL